MKPKTTGAWTEYINQQTKARFDKPQMQPVDVEKLINVNRLAYNVLNHSVPMVYLLDYTTGNYRFVSNHCEAQLGFSFKKMMDGGISFVADIYNPDDLQLFDRQIFPDRLKLLKAVPISEHKNLIFSFNFRLQNSSGGFTNILQRNAFIQSDEQGNPLMSMGVVTNVNHFKTENPVIQLVEKVNTENGSVELLQKSTYYLREDDKVFSKRELEVLSYLADGLTSKEIAGKLFISEHTVINHKRSMHNKSNTQNSAALISFAFKQHLL